MRLDCFRVDRMVFTISAALILAGCGGTETEGTFEETSSVSEPIGGTGTYHGYVDYLGTAYATARIQGFQTGMPHRDANGVVQNRTNGCTGTFLTRSWVITANHCIKTDTPGDYEVYFGGSRANPTETRVVDQVIRHPTNMQGLTEDWKTEQGIDFALLHVTAISGLSSGFKTSLFKGVASELVGQQVVCVGWGCTSDNGCVDAPYLRYESFPVDYIEGGRTNTTNGRVRAVGDWMTIHDDPTTRLLGGDSGGGCFYFSDGVNYLVGVVAASYLTSVSEESVRYWINQNVPELSGSMMARRPGAAYRSQVGYRDVFFADSARTLIHKWYPYNSGWSWAQALGSNLSGPPSATSRFFGGTNFIDAFWRGSDFTLRHKWYPYGADWSFEQVLGGTGAWNGRMASEPGVVSWGGDRLDAFWRGPDNSLQHTWYPGGGQAWAAETTPGGHFVTGTPSAASRSSGHLAVFWRNAANDMIASTWYPDNGAWHVGDYQIGGVAASEPSAAHVGNGWIFVYYRGTDGNLKHFYAQSDTAWTGPFSDSLMPMLSAPAISADPNAPGVFDIYYVTDEATPRLVRYTTTNYGWAWSAPTFISWN